MSPVPRSLMSDLVPEVAASLRAAVGDQAFEEADRRFRSLIEHVPVVVYLASFDEAGTLRYVSPRITDLTGRTADELLADQEEWYRCVHPEDVDRVRAAELEAFEAQQEFDCEFRMVHRDGHVVHVWERDTVVRDEAGTPIYTQGVLLDVTPLRIAEAALVSESNRAQQFLDVAGVTLLAVDADGVVTMLNRAGHELLGYEDGELIGANYFHQCLPGGGADYLERFREHLAADMIAPEAETRVLCRDGSQRIVHWQTTVLREDGIPVGLLSSGTDVTERREVEEQIAHMAYHDSLTGLPNRAMLRDHLELALARATRNDHSVALLYLDLDDFKLVNDGLGHAAGDELLRATAARLVARLRDQDLVAREGGDEFLVLLADLDRNADARAVAAGEALVEVLRAPFELSGTEFEINGSIGISLFPRDARDAEGLLANADSAMYEAKAAGRGKVRVFSGRGQRSSERLSLSRRLRCALEQDELVLHWQPIVGLSDGLLKGAEALVRWDDPQRGLQPASAFVDDMQAAGMLEQLDEWVASALTAQRREWQQIGLDPYVGFNLGPRALNALRVDRILACLGAGDMDLSRVTIEISESEALRDDVTARAALRRLHGAGLTLALDDFGVAYSSLSRLRDLPTEWIKIDKSFLSGVPHHPAATRVLDAILQLLDALESRVIVEGVESEAQLEYLHSQACEAAQGFHLCPPKPAAELEDMLRASPDSQPALRRAS